MALGREPRQKIRERPDQEGQTAVLFGPGPRGRSVERLTETVEVFRSCELGDARAMVRLHRAEDPLRREPERFELREERHLGDSAQQEIALVGVAWCSRTGAEMKRRKRHGAPFSRSRSR